MTSTDHRSTVPAAHVSHRHLVPAVPVDALKGRPVWGEPGEITKLAGEDRWGRIALLCRICGARCVMFAAFGGEDAEVRHLPLVALENPWEAYPVNLPPRGYPIPKAWPGKGEKPFPGRG